MQGISIPLTGTHIPSGAPQCFHHFFCYHLWTFHSIISPWTTLAKVTGISPITLFLWLVSFERTEMACSLCWYDDSWKHWSSSTLVYFDNYSIDDINPQFDFCNSETNDPCFVTQEGILVFDFQMCFERSFFKKRFFI